LQNFWTGQWCVQQNIQKWKWWVEAWSNALCGMGFCLWMEFGKCFNVGSLSKEIRRLDNLFWAK
jgi:hypothetical protein